ncbi:MAG TPA: 3-hydroxyacyl-CoA dehydrogenase NAD-binding domain-containing protein [Chitinophagales bacterium]|nr:3-hydroxyacyl-CoA dehydrogenase NAD-binding domain-containing protein [Chitinophagales bacterium]HNM09565.1 3-hydroxyacyl-CoA dehydrogenase NAD-binding domain-containing protein [Chitinophagales bacterium]HNM29292.1 3-hydroxyacyl-CoA dehydrogenase NAD-binding domain-containing protein [Chitinophagales bacterium]
MNRIIKKIAVLGSGVMGSRIACHFANIGIEVLLLDIVPLQATEEQLKQPAFRNKIVNDSLQAAIKQNPSPVYSQKVLKRITTGNFDDDMERIADCDWVMEVVVENLTIKQQLFEKVDKHRKQGTLVTSNTSGIPIALMSEGRSEDFRRHFCGTHFFNPPRYLRLLEIIPGPDTEKSVIDFLMNYGDRYLGKTTVLCKDTPAFIANRVGVFGMMAVLKVMEEMQFSIAQVEALTGPIYGRPKSATFRTADVVGIDTFVKVAQNTYAACPDDESRDIFQIPAYINTLVENKWLGDKSGQGFFKKVKNAQGQSEILTLDLNTLEYQPSTKAKFAALDAAKPIDNLKDRIRTLHATGDKASEFYNKLNALVFKYVSHRIPEIADELYKIDDAMRAGFGWELGPFEIWDVLGVEKFVAWMEQHGTAPASWVKEMLQKGYKSFYLVENGKRKYYDARSGGYVLIPGMDAFIILDNYRAQKPVWQNSGATLHDIGDGILNLEFHTKMNVVGSEILEGIQKSIDIAEKNYRGLVIGNDAANFSAGANIAMMLMLAIEQEFDELDMAIRVFQNTVARIRFSGIPVAVAPHGLTLGGGCEMTMHADVAVAAAETYIGLVEVGAGLIPAGGGTKELALRASEKYFKGDIEIPTLQEMSLNIAMAKVATSAREAFEFGLLRNGIDKEVINGARLIAEAKKQVLSLADAGYVQPKPKSDIRVLGRSALGSFYVGIASMRMSGYISEYDEKIAKKVAYVISGGDLSMPTEVNEQYLLDLEREAFLSLLGERKTLERMQHILKTGKPLRN